MASLFAVATAAAARTRERRGGVTPVSNIWTRLSCSTRVSPPRIPDRPASTAARRVGDVEALGQMRARPPVVEPWAPWRLARSGSSPLTCERGCGRDFEQ